MGDPGREFEFELPSELIAQDPCDRRQEARMLLVESGRGVVGERAFAELPGLLRAGDLLVLNDSRVLPARLDTRRLDTGGRVEILLVRPADQEFDPAPGPLAGPPPGRLRTWLALARPARRLKRGAVLEVRAGAGSPAAGSQAAPPRLTVLEILPGGEVLVGAEQDPGLLAQAWGSVPLPPYIRRPPGAPDAVARAAADRDRYQTVYAADGANVAGSVAAPTAGLHFSPEVLQALPAAGVDTVRVRLHVGPGTFRPPGQAQFASRRLHPEYFTLGAEVFARIAAARAASGRVIAVGTTSLRVLETVARLDLDHRGEDLVCGQDRTCPQDQPCQEHRSPPLFEGSAVRRGDGWEVAGFTRLFILPPDRVTAADGLLTNFHLPGSSLLMLVASMLGPQVWPQVYREAVQRRLRFFSYGDCMLILPEGKEHP